MIDSNQTLTHLKQRSRCRGFFSLPIIDSTNNFIRQCLPKKKGDFSIVVADYQTDGRGRMGRIWISPAGAHLTFSLALVIKRTSFSTLPLAVSIALIRALSCYDKSAFSIKWPNDIWYYGRKISGILIENVAQCPEYSTLVMGVGLNIKKIALPDIETCAALDEIPGFNRSDNEVLAHVINHIVEALDEYSESGFHNFMPEWQQYDALKNLLITATLPTHTLSGRYHGISAEGLLKLKADDGRLHVLSAADVSIRTNS